MPIHLEQSDKIQREGASTSESRQTFPEEKLSGQARLISPETIAQEENQPKNTDKNSKEKISKA